MDNDLLKWIENWYKNNCNGDWEHSYGITIETLDNPGWDIKIDLKNTLLEHEKIEYTLNEKNDNDWFSMKVDNAMFIASGDPDKLSLLLGLFKKFAEDRAT